MNNENYFLSSLWRASGTNGVHIRLLIGAGFILFLVITFASCQDISPLEKPDNFIPEKEMEAIMYEALLLRAARGASLGKLTAAGIDPETYVLEKFGIDSTQYSENIAYYTSELPLYTAMQTRITDRVEAILKVEDSLEKIERKINDSLRLKRARDNEKERMAKKKKDSALGIYTPITRRPSIKPKDSTSLKKSKKSL